MKIKAFLAISMSVAVGQVLACTNFLVTPGASADGSSMVSMPLTRTCFMVNYIIGPQPLIPQVQCSMYMIGTQASIWGRLSRPPRLTT